MSDAALYHVIRWSVVFSSPSLACFLAAGRHRGGCMTGAPACLGRCALGPPRYRSSLSRPAEAGTAGVTGTSLPLTTQAR
jgi:hypothetical protein